MHLSPGGFNMTIDEKFNKLISDASKEELVNALLVLAKKIQEVAHNRKDARSTYWPECPIHKKEETLKELMWRVGGNPKLGIKADGCPVIGEYYCGARFGDGEKTKLCWIIWALEEVENE